MDTKAKRDNQAKKRRILKKKHRKFSGITTQLLYTPFELRMGNHENNIHKAIQMMRLDLDAGQGRMDRLSR